MTAPILKLPAKIERLQAAAEEEWQLLGKAVLAGQQADTHARMHRQYLGEHLIKLRAEVRKQFLPLPSTGGRPRDVWWGWFEQWQPPGKRGSITRDEATRAMKIAGDEDPDDADAAMRTRKREEKRRNRGKVSRATASSVAQESAKPISLIVRRVEGMIRKMSPEDREVLFERIKELLP